VARAAVGETRPVRRVLLAGLVAAAACGGGDDPAGCAAVVEHPIDPASSVHVIAGAAVEYGTEPPTSGPHSAVGDLFDADAGAVLEEPLPRPVQVGLLEVGAVLVQWDPGLEPALADEVAALAEPGAVITAPGRDLPAPIVATAWGASLRCDTPDGELAAFAAERVGQGPGAHD